MKAVVLAAGFGIALGAMPVASMAACATPSVRVNTLAALNTLLSNNTACVPAVTVPTMTWQEWHQPGTQGVASPIVDYKRGPGHAVDPSKPVGTWTVFGSDGRTFVRYDYGGGHIYSYQVWSNGDGTHSFCSANPEIVAKIKPGNGPC